MELVEISCPFDDSWHVHYGCRDCSIEHPGIYCISVLTEEEAHKCGKILRGLECACKSEEYLEKYFGIHMYTKSYLIG